MIAAVALPLAAFALAGPYYFDRPFWSDEILSWLIASDADSDHALAALAGGVDTNAPLLHLLFRLVGDVFGATPLVYRLTCFAGMSTALAGLYFILRRVVDVASAAFGSLCCAALPIIIAHATEARFYSFELATFLWTAYWLARRGDRATVANAAIIALLSAALCGVHYFGVVALAALVGGTFLTRRLTSSSIDRVFPTIAGPAMTACLLPLIVAQRTAMRDAGGTWVPDDFVTNVYTTVSMLLPVPTLIAIAIAALVARMVKSRHPERDEESGVSPLTACATQNASILLVAAAAIYIVVMLAFDRLVQPVFVPRYFIVALPAVAAIMAMIAARWPLTLRRAATTIAACAIAFQLVAIRVRARAPSGRSAAGLLASVHSIDPTIPIVSDWLGHALPIAVEGTRPVFYVADARLHEAGFDEAIRYERQMAACVQRFYALPAPARRGDVDHLDRFILLSEFPESVHERFNDYEVQPLGTVTLKLTRRTSAADAR